MMKQKLDDQANRINTLSNLQNSQNQNAFQTCAKEFNELVNDGSGNDSDDWDHLTGNLLDVEPNGYLKHDTSSNNQSQKQAVAQKNEQIAESKHAQVPQQTVVPANLTLLDAK